jgi:hypothetical protein
VGGNIELVRWPTNILPTIERDGETFRVTQPSPKGHIFKLVPIDGATIAPTHDPEFPVMQKVQGDMANAVFFGRNEIGRIVLTPRPEMRVKGYGMPPPQRIYMAISLLYYGNQYYARLLLDTPEAGILDLLDMSQQDAEDWVTSYQSLLQGVDPQKIGVLYQHTQAAKWIPFGRPPSEMSYDNVTLKQQRVVAAGYWLTLADIGLEPGGKTMAGEIRRQRESRLTGFGMISEKTKNFINSDVLPPYLEFAWIEKDDEAMAATGRARLLNAQALAKMVEGGLIQAEDGQAQLKKDGLLTVELQPRPKETPAPLPPPSTNGALPAGGNKDQTNNELERVPPSAGGRGEAGRTQKAILGDPAISAVEPGSSNFDRLGLVFKNAFDAMLKRMGDIQLRRLIKAALKAQFPIASKAIINLSEADRAQWAEERFKSWFGEESIFDQIPQVQKVDKLALEDLEKLLEDDRWWELPPEVVAQVLEILNLAFSEGATVAAEMVQQFLYEEGLVSSPDLIGFNFNLKNPVTINRAAGVDEGVSSQEIAARIAEGQGLDEILRESELVAKVTQRARGEIEGLSGKRIESIVNTEINRAESEGRLEQWAKQGLTKKQFLHTGSDIPCSFCQAAIDEGIVDIDFGYTNVFGDKVQSSPLHPTVDHCHVAFSEEELISKSGELNVWTGD